MRSSFDRGPGFRSGVQESLGNGVYDMCVCRVGVDRVSGLGSMLYGTTLRGHVPSDLAFRSHLGSSLELSCLPELGAVFFSMSSDSGQEKLLKMYNISCRYNGPFRHWKVVPGYVYDIVYAHTNSAASQEQLAERPNNNPIVDGRTELEHYLDNHEMKGFYERWDETGLALRILLAPSLQEPPTTISVMHGNWLGITEPVDEDPTSSHKEEDDTEVAAYWKARRDKEEADIMANFNERAMAIVVAALGLRPGSTSAFATSAVSVVQPAPFSTLQEDTSAVSVVQPAPFRKVASPVAHAVAHAHADAPVAHADADADADTPPDTEADADHLSYQCPDKCCWICGYADHLSYQCPDKCCWICGYADHLSYVCPDKGCWICGYMDHWSDHCPDNCCWICGDRGHWSYRCPRNIKIYDSLVEAMIDLRFKDLHGEDLMSAYLIDIAALEQRVDNVNELGCRILQERLGLLRRKAEELAMVIG